MADIFTCLSEAVANGTLSEAGLSEYRQRMRDAEELARQRGLAGPEAYLFATTEAAKEMERRATARRAQIQQTILAVDRAWQGASRNRFGIQWGLTDVFGEHVRGEGSGSSIGQQQRGNLAALQSIMADTLSRMQSRMAGLKQNAILPRHTVSELFGKDTGDAAAKEAAKAWDAALGWWRDGMERAGVFVRQLEDWRLPQHWDAGAVKATGKDAFVDRLSQWWRAGDLRLRDWQADGQAYLAPGLAPAEARAREIFEKAYDNITSGGLDNAAVLPRSLTQPPRRPLHYPRPRAHAALDPRARCDFGVGRAAPTERACNP